VTNQDTHSSGDLIVQDVADGHLVAHTDQPWLIETRISPIEGVVVTVSPQESGAITGLFVDLQVVDPLDLSLLLGVKVGDLHELAVGDAFEVDQNRSLIRVATLHRLQTVPHPTRHTGVWALEILIEAAGLRWIEGEFDHQLRDLEYEAISFARDWIAQPAFRTVEGGAVIVAAIQQLPAVLPDDSDYLPSAEELASSSAALELWDFDLLLPQPVAMSDEPDEFTSPVLWDRISDGTKPPGDWFHDALKIRRNRHSVHLTIDTQDTDAKAQDVLFAQIGPSDADEAQWVGSIRRVGLSGVFAGRIPIDGLEGIDALRFDITDGLHHKWLTETAWLRYVAAQWVHLGRYWASRGPDSYPEASAVYARGAATLADGDAMRTQIQQLVDHPETDAAPCLADLCQP